ncbi:hypothetical protein J4457_06630 [Candidatus Woesearchaeota archaeon]|nr:hypothetical protein [Candidatus Woesearchaeota archaeon]
MDTRPLGGAHKRQIEYLESHYKNFTKAEILFIDELRVVRNKVSYDGFFVKGEYLDRKLVAILQIIANLNDLVTQKL